MPDSLRQRLLGPAVLLALVVLFHWKLVFTDQYTWLETSEVANVMLPWFQFQASEWHHSRFPLWDPNSSLGLPVLGQGAAGAADPLNWLLFLVPFKHGWIREAALHWYYVLASLFSGPRGLRTSSRSRARPSGVHFVRLRLRTGREWHFCNDMDAFDPALLIQSCQGPPALG